MTTTDAKGTTITSTYDALNRPLTRTYSDGTPTVTNYYDGAGLPSVPNYSKGKLTRVSSSVSDTRYTAFDVAGRLTQTQQITSGNTYTSGYQYNLAGALTQETYPNGWNVNTVFDSSGNISRVYRVLGGDTERTYADSFTFSPDGKIKQLRLGNNLWETAQFNSRLQVTEFALGTTQGASNTWKANYDYGELQTNGTVDATKNSGNIGKQTVTFSGLANPFVQGYKYDPLDRITEAKETVNGTQTWIQNWGYDRYGNRSSFSQNIFGYTSVSNPTISSTTNRFTSGGFTFDKNGNVTFDHNGYEFTYDGNNKQTQAILSTQKGGVVTLGTYYYDGEGKRVKKTTHTSDNVIFVYSNGKLVEERNASTNALQTSYVYAGSQLLSTETSSATNYTVTDNLGSPRVIVNGSGTIVARRDFLPFGEELFADGTYRKTSDGYGTSGADAVRQRFTGYQKDTETGLDFAEARMYQNQHGRFTAVDPLLASGKSANPQTFNRYVYTMNRPLILVDSTGLQAGKYEGKVYTDGKQFSNVKNKGWSQFDGDEVAKFGDQQFRVTGSGWNPVAAAGPNPNENPWGYELSKVSEAISSAGKQFTDLVYAAAPDYCRAQISAPLMPQFEISGSKDLNVFAGGGVTDSIFDGKGFMQGASKFNFLNGAKSIGFKVQASVTCGYFLTSSMAPAVRDRAIEGTNVTGSANLPFAPMINGGLSKSLPVFGGPPASVEAGIGPNTGIGVSSSKKIFSFNEWLKKNSQAQK